MCQNTSYLQKGTKDKTDMLSKIIGNKDRIKQIYMEKNQEEEYKRYMEE